MQCRARCQDHRLPRKHPVPLSFLHVGRGWRRRPCPTCKAEPASAATHRLGARPPARRPAAPRGDELTSRWRVWEQLPQRGANAALVSLSGRGGHGGQATTISLCRREGAELIEIKHWTASRDELYHALEAPVEGRYGAFTGHSQLDGSVIWLADERRVLISGHRGLWRSSPEQHLRSTRQRTAWRLARLPPIRTSLSVAALLHFRFGPGRLAPRKHPRATGLAA